MLDDEYLIGNEADIVVRYYREEERYFHDVFVLYFGSR